jgi:hypothetical protein
MTLDEVRAQMRALPSATRFDGAPVAEARAKEVGHWLHELDDASRQLRRFRARLVGTLGRVCGHCGGPMARSLAPQARYCGRSCRQRAYEQRAQKVR